MKTLRLFALLLFAVCSFGLLPRISSAQDEEVSFDYFYDNLSPYGDWVELADYGLSWHPRDMPEDWAPYTDGYWAYTDAGWTWVSYEDFGGITYHYGRWVRVDDEGWCWVPGNDWGPAWVSWRNSNEYVGWAPLPPEARFEANVGFSTWVDDTYDIGPDYYRFCRVEDFSAPVIREVCVPRARNITIVHETVNITNITINSGFGVPFCGGPQYDVISRRTFRPIPALKLVRERNLVEINRDFRGGDGRRGIASLQRGNTLVVAAPRMREITDRRAPLPNIRPVRTIAADRVNRGFSRDRSPQEREQYRDFVKQQLRGATPQSAPAKAFTAAETQIVPVKADPDAPSPVTGRARGDRPGREAAGRGNQPGRDGAGRPNATPAKTGPAGNEVVGDDNRTARQPGTDAAAQPGDGRSPGMDTPDDKRPGRGVAGATPAATPVVGGRTAGRGRATPAGRPARGRATPPAATERPATTTDGAPQTPGEQTGRDATESGRPARAVKGNSPAEGVFPGSTSPDATPRVPRQPFRQGADATDREGSADRSPTNPTTPVTPVRPGRADAERGDDNPGRSNPRQPAGRNQAPGRDAITPRSPVTPQVVPQEREDRGERPQAPQNRRSELNGEAGRPSRGDDGSAALARQQAAMQARQRSAEESGRGREQAVEQRSQPLAARAAAQQQAAQQRAAAVQGARERPTEAQRPRVAPQAQPQVQRQVPAATGAGAAVQRDPRGARGRDRDND